MNYKEYFLLEAVNQEALESLMLLVKKLAPKSYKSKPRLQDAIQNNSIAYNVSKGAGSNVPEGKKLFVDWYDGGRAVSEPAEYSEERLQKANTSIEGMVSLFKQLGVKQNRKVTKEFA